MTTPFQNFPPASMLLAPRVTLTSDPATSVQGINTYTLADGTIVYCLESATTFRLDRADSTTPPDGVTVIQPTAGPGRWKVFGAAAASPLLAISEVGTLIGQSAPGVTGYVEASPGVPLEATFPTWNAGDVLMVEWWAVVADTSGTNLQIRIEPVVDVGAGFKFFDGDLGTAYNVLTVPNNAGLTQLSNSVAVALATKPTVRLTMVRLGGADDISLGNVLLRCTRTAAGLWVAGPAGVLLP